MDDVHCPLGPTNGHVKADFSILMPAYNCEAWIGQAIQSCIDQTHKDWELIVVDDGSADKTLAVAQGYAERDSRILVFSIPHAGAAGAYNVALEKATGNYIARLDADDWDDPTRLEKCATRLRSHPLCDIVSTWCMTCWGEERAVDKGQMVPELFMSGSERGFPVNASIVAKREIYDAVGGFNTKIVSGQDTEWNVRATLYGARWAVIPEPLYFYHQHAAQTSKLLSYAQHMANYKAWTCAAAPAWNDPYGVNRCIEFFTTGACQRKCPDCSQYVYVKDHAGYQAPLALVEKLCQRAIDIGATYEWVNLSGGEPLLWKNLEEACKIIKDSGAFKKIRMFTNGDQLERLDHVMEAGLLDLFYLNTTISDPPVCELARNKYPTRSVFDTTGHKPLPLIPDETSLPAVCFGNRLAVMDNVVYPCKNFYTHAVRTGADPAQCACTLDDDWIGFFRKVDRMNMEVCKYCLANRRIWNKLPRVSAPASTKKAIFSLVLLGRNEEHTLPRLFKSVQHVDCERIFVDTGSTDRSVAIAKANGCEIVEAGTQFMEHIPNWECARINREFVVGDEAPIVDNTMSFFRFDRARNFAAAQAKEHNFLITPDCDESFRVLDVDAVNATIKSGATRFAYDFTYSWNPNGTAAIKFRTDTRCFDRTIWKWRGFVHETLQGTGSITYLAPDVMDLEHHQEFGKEHRGNYLAGLAAACYKEPSGDRNMHYFGRELVNQQRPQSAIKVLERHLGLSKWPMEMSASLCFMGDAYQKLGNEPRATVCWQSAISLCGTWREPWMRLAWFFYHKGAHQAVASLCAAALQIPNPYFYGSLQVNYQGLPHELFYWALCHLGRVKEAKAHWEEAMKWKPELISDAKFFEGV